MPKIIVSYRRSDSAAMAGRICDRLIARYGADSVFMDIDNIPFAIDFRDHVRDTLKRSDVVLAVVGPRWRGASEGHVRIEDEDDPVRAEIELAITTGVPIFPILVDGAAMPQASELPDSLKRFAFINAAPVDTGRDFHQHIDRLIRSLDQMLGAKAGASGPLSPSRVGFADTATKPASSLLDWLRSPVPWAFAGVIAVPFGAAYGALTPPWPPGIEIATAILQTVAFILSQHRLRLVSTAAINRMIVFAAVLLTLASTAYLFAGSIYVYQTPTTKEHWVKGYACTREAQMVYKDKCPYLGSDELRSAEYEAERLWTVQSIAVVKVALVAIWLIACLALAILISNVLVYYRRGQAAAPLAASG